MSDDNNPAPPAKPDGSVYQQQMRAIAERNAAAQKVGRAQRREREELQLKERLARDRRTDSGLRAKGK